MKQIIALGGGGFSMEPENPLLDQYILRQSGKIKPKICFIPTASGDSETYTQRFYDFFEQQDCSPTHLSLFKPPAGDLEEFVLAQDILYVGGGNTKNLLALWKDWGLDAIIRKAWEQGTVLAGISAGSLCWFEDGITDSYGDHLEPIHCLGFLAGSNCPHYDGEENRRPVYQRSITLKAIKGGIAADDGAALHYIGTELHRVVSSRQAAKAYEVSYKEALQEVELPVVYLGDQKG
ncbi:Type 1 glutamine amidotransferase-like domain-containing protein [Planococcus ruber]|uniref:Type 1 glutamine amidotransferase-like domain-containing protein n=1 Tax=Planococcus ruber TaxID=2027871 RepID=UPI001FED9DFC|nr:Type 1 glutamine amidotransferase-like domain-containing protein [Planococcus ruber]MCJ1907593.1 Type 1 glutamine amidotransferase-like domain-containing protein [Planococcus ruber]